jgi:hypothetical protein
MAEAHNLGPGERYDSPNYDAGSFYERGRYYTEVRSFSSSRINQWGWSSVVTPMLSIGRLGPGVVLVPQSKTSQAVRMLQPLVSFELVKEWFDMCCTKHTKACGFTTSVSSIPSFRLIDCKTRRIVPNSNHRYVALSYI